MKAVEQYFPVVLLFYQDFTKTILGIFSNYGSGDIILGVHVKSNGIRPGAFYKTADNNIARFKTE